MKRRPVIGITSRIIADTDSSLPFWGVRANYPEAVMSAGGVPVVFPMTDDDALLSAVYQVVDGILLPGGEDVDPNFYGEQPLYPLRSPCPARDRMEIALAKRAIEDQKPVLAICRGLQIINVALGGTLYQDLTNQYPGATEHTCGNDIEEWCQPIHNVRLTAGSRLSQLLATEEVGVNSLHHQAIAKLGKGLRAVGFSPEGVIEAVESENGTFVLGVQWHPEMMHGVDSRWGAIFHAFIDEVSKSQAPTAVR